MVLDSGEGITHAVPIEEGRVHHYYAIERNYLAGCDVTEFLRNYMKF
jgi:actin-related protein